MKDWISCKSNGRVSRYVITPEGRSALQRIIARREHSATGFCEDQAGFVIASSQTARDLSRVRFHSNEGPLAILGRRRCKDGKPFLSRDLVRAWERLREDFELAHLEPVLTQDWTRFLAPTSGGKRNEGPANAPRAARDRLQSAFEALGQGLSDIALRCCCHMEGMEVTEKRLGWPARSGKIVLRIALTRLAQHYSTYDPEVGDLIL